MSLLYGYSEEEAREPFTTTGGEMRAPIDMRFWAFKKVPAPIYDYNVVGKKSWKTSSRRNTSKRAWIG